MTEQEIGTELEREVIHAMAQPLAQPLKASVKTDNYIPAPVAEEMQRRKNLPSSKLRDLQDTTAVEIMTAEEELDKIKAFAAVKVEEINERAADRITKLQADIEHVLYQIEELNKRHLTLTGKVEDEEINRDNAIVEARDYYNGEIAIAQKIIDAKRDLHRALHQG